MPQNTLITIQNCRIDNSRKTIVQNINWTMNAGENWLVIGPNGGGKADFLNALAGVGGLKITPNAGQDVSLFSNSFAGSTEIVSLERAAKIIQEERDNDESDYVEGGVDIGRTARMFIAQSLWPDIKKGKPLPPEAQEFDNRPEIELTGIKKILDRGLKYLSTGEIRRTLLARALISGKQLLILSDPFAGLDAQSRKIIFDFIEREMTGALGLILGMERWNEIPDTITHVLEFTNKEISFCGARGDYEKVMHQRETLRQAQGSQVLVLPDNGIVVPERVEGLQNSSELDSPLVQMTNVNVAWGDNHVLRNLNWTVNKGEHWLIQGPNGSGKTTLLELITGDNMQVFCNDVKLFGKKRGSGETIWDIKKQLGIVSYRLHVEYRMLGGTSLLNVIISGFRDSIGLYEAAKDTEIDLAKKWLAFGGFSGRENESFGNLSYGEQRAILILRSAVKSPALLILDEPCHGLDENFRTKVLHLMELIGEGGTTTMLHVTHDPTEILPCEKNILQLCPQEDPMYVIKTIRH
ncbi:MAG: ATP-binding cassette domain-containing protein [Treponema sp.]|nr:ATP-binding cassette domain-containing protein [Treponema sp.]